MKTKEQTPIEWFAEQLGITSGTTFLKAKDMEANINWLLDKQIKDLTAENEIYKNKLADFESEMIRQMIFGDLSTNSIQAKEKLAVTIQAKDSNIEPPLYVKTNNLRYAKKGVQIVKEIETFELRLQQMWQGSDGSEKWEWVEIVENMR